MAVWEGVCGLGGVWNGKRGLRRPLPSLQTLGPPSPIFTPVSPLCRYSYPLRAGKAQRVPSWAVPVIATVAPLAALLAHRALARPSRLEFHASLLGLAGAILSTGAATNLLKIGVGRPRPNFAARCWPGGAAPAFDASGIAVCAPGAVRPLEGRKSFPSGHTSWTTAGLGYLSFWAAGKLRVWCPDAAGHPARLVVASAPLCVAIWVGVTRLQARCRCGGVVVVERRGVGRLRRGQGSAPRARSADTDSAAALAPPSLPAGPPQPPFPPQDYWHHPSDVAAGFCLGAGLAYAHYRQAFHCFTSRRAGEAHAGGADGGGGGAGGVEMPPV